MSRDKLLTARIYSDNGAHATIIVWQHGGKAGELTVESKHAKAVVDRIEGRTNGARRPHERGRWKR